jgi:hypothetical protein
MIKLLVIISTLLAMLTAPALAANDTNNKIFSTCAQNPSSSICQDKAQQNQNPTDNPVNNIIHVAANIVALLTGVVAVIFIIISGFKFITAGGSIGGQRSADPNSLKSARATLSAAIIGLIIVALAWTIITFLTDKLIKT